MFDSQKFQNLLKQYNNGDIVFVFYDRFTKKFGPLNVCKSINEVVFTACNFIKDVELKNISLSHIEVYIAGYANVDTCFYDLNEPAFFFNASDYKDAYNTVLMEVTNE